MAEKQPTTDELMNKQIGTIRAQAARATWMATRMADMPQAYREHMPVTEDPEQLMAAEQKLREQLRHDYKTTALGKSMHAVQGEVRAQQDALRDAGQLPAEEAAPQAATDISKMTASEKILAGLKGSKPSRQPAGAVNSRAAGPAQSPMSVGGGTGNDYSKMSSQQKLMLGLGSSRPSQAPRGGGRRPAA